MHVIQSVTKGLDRQSLPLFGTSLARLSIKNLQRRDGGKSMEHSVMAGDSGMIVGWLEYLGMVRVSRDG